MINKFLFIIFIQINLTANLLGMQENIREGSINLENLSSEILVNIFYFVSQKQNLPNIFSDINNLSLVNKKFRSLIKEDSYNSVTNNAFKYYIQSNNDTNHIVEELFRTAKIPHYSSYVEKFLSDITNKFSKSKIQNKWLLNKFAIFLNNNRNIKIVNKIHRSLNNILIKASAYNNVKLVKLLVKFCDINFKNKNQDSALTLAAYNANTKIVNILLKNNADINIQNAYGNTPLIIASIKNYNKIVKSLISHNADPDIQDNTGNTALTWAIMRGHDYKDNINSYLHIEHYTSTNDFKPSYDEIIDILIQAGANNSIKNMYGQTAITLTAKNRQYYNDQCIVS